MKNEDIDPKIYDFYDEYCHGVIDRREFLRKSSKLAIGAVAALSMAEALLPRYAAAQTISFTDERIKATYVTYPSPGGNSNEMRAYLVQPAGEGPFPPVLIVHENRGLNPHIEDVARRAAVEGFLALAPDALHPVGGYPGNDDDGRALQRSLDRDKLKIDMLNSARFLKSHALAGDKLGVTGFCWGGSVSNYLAATMGDELAAAVPFYGSGVSAEEVANIKAHLMIQAAEKDDRINAAWPDFEAALKKHKINYVRHMYEGTKHGFHNNSTPRYEEWAAKLAWKRTVNFFKGHLSQ
ncbi:MAG: dienelactone hydrolase family protein [Gammaproteobacteria bacterium]|nr:dienelactone hydrolase family protein [Gammaproteobacteria bacterium]NNC97800.1 dienelactone hydrolase family protein [Gammaproteobacteria bacterium]NNM13727.1 dienelactone hydrolase family protein [Gammaproteobacteria bacterium]